MSNPSRLDVDGQKFFLPQRAFDRLLVVLDDVAVPFRQLVVDQGCVGQILNHVEGAVTDELGINDCRIPSVIFRFVEIVLFLFYSFEAFD